MSKSIKKTVVESDISKPWKIGLTFLLFVHLIFYYCQKQNLLTADLGRHIKNGEYFLEHLEPITTNYYSYTQADFPTRTHHWGAGVIYYMLYKMGGFEMLSLLNVFLYMSAFLLFFKTSLRKSNYSSTIFFSLLALPVITNRLEIRPEVFSYVFVAIYFFLLSLFSDGKLKWQYLWILPFVQILWVNTHILFPMGLFLIAVFAFGELLQNRKEHLKKLAIVFGASSLASLFNYFGIEGIVEPFTILNNYGMDIVENKDLLFMLKRRTENASFFRVIFDLVPHLQAIIYYHVILLSLILLLGIGLLIKIKKHKEFSSYVIISIVFGIVAWKMIRNFPLLGFVFIPLASIVWFQWQSYKTHLQKQFKLIALSGSCFFLFTGFVFPSIKYLQQWSYTNSIEKLRKEFQRKVAKRKEINEEAEELDHKRRAIYSSLAMCNYYSPYKLMTWGLGLVEGCNVSAEFIKRNKIDGPYFNNYDIGSYFIFHLFPTYKPFVDNRPEAYSVDFFKEMFIPMQQDTTDITWNKFDEQYHFNAIYFYRHDQTPYGQPFLIRRVKDPNWIPVFVDDNTILMVRNAEKNATIIQQYALDKSMFTAVPN